jgi:hypothetical protein
MNPYLQMFLNAFAFFVLPIAGPVVLGKCVMKAKEMFMRTAATSAAVSSAPAASAPVPEEPTAPNAFTDSHLGEVQGMEIPVHADLPPEFDARPVAAAASHQTSKQGDLFEATHNTEFDPLPAPAMDF